jgi:hypothetical protein
MQAVDRAALAKVMAKREATVDFSSGGADAAISITMSGLQSLMDTISEMSKYAIDAAGTEMSKILEEVIEDSRANYVPYKDGYLRDSAGWDEWSDVKNSAKDLIELRMWFGSPLSASQARQADKIWMTHGLKVPDPSAYAEDQHENLSYHHPNVGVVSNPQAKYLEKPFNIMEPKILGRLSNAISVAWGGSLSSDDIISEVSGTTPLDPVAARIESAPKYPGYGSKRK